jgi:Ser/Thr protein kinase RdoA (MazF antagonist)
MGLTGNDRKLLDRLVDRLRQRLDRFGKSPERFGLIHADLRLANLLVENGETKVIDFDDCGFGWYLYDFGTAVSFIEHRSDMDELIASWVDGYRRVVPLCEEEENEIPTFIMMRRLLLTAWIASHSDTELAQAQGIDYTEGTCALAEAYLRNYG